MVSIYFENQYMRELCRRYFNVIYKEIINLQVPLNYQSKYNMSNLNIIYADYVCLHIAKLVSAIFNFSAR